MLDWSNLPSLATLRAFAVYAETQSVTAAGQALNVSHAAISQQLRALETHMGVALLDRSGKQMALTATGAQLAQATQQGFATILTALDDISGRDAARPLQVSTTPSFAAAWLMPRLPTFRAAHPEISLMIDPSPALRQLEPGGMDVALRYGTGDWQGLDSEMLVPSTIVCICAPELLGTTKDVSLSEMSEFDWLEEFGTHESSEWFARQGVVRGNPHTVISLPGHLMVEAARQGQGIGMTARINVESDIAAGRLRVIFEEAYGHGYHMVTRPGVARPNLAHFMRWLRREAGTSRKPQMAVL